MSGEEARSAATMWERTVERLPLWLCEVIVKVKLWPKTVGLAEDTISVLELALPTVCVSVPLLARKLPSPA